MYGKKCVLGAACFDTIQNNDNEVAAASVGHSANWTGRLQLYY